MRDPASPTTLKTEARAGWVLFALILAVHLWCVHLGWSNVPVDGHEFRQTQTAISIRYLAQDGLRLDYPTPLLGKPWSIPLEFPLYQNATALLIQLTGLPIPQAGRIVGLLFFYLTLPGLYLLAGRLALPPARRLLVLCAILASPLFLFYPRAVMIETTTLCLCVWFLWAYWRALATGTAGVFALALGCGVLAAMVKLPTLVVFLLPAALILLRETRPVSAATTAHPGKLRKLLTATSLIGISLGAGLVWTAHADAVKAQNPLASFLMSAAVGDWSMGPVMLRFTPAFWASICSNTSHAVLGYPGLIVLAILACLPARPGRREMWLLLACFVPAPLIFANLYQLHDYYFLSPGIFLLTAFGLALGRMLDLAVLPRPIAWLVVAGLLSLGIITYSRTYYRLIPANETRVPQLSRALKAVTHADDVIVIYGQDWNPVLAYTAERRALMIPPGIEMDPVAQAAAFVRLGTERVGALVVTGAMRDHPDLLQPVIRRFGLTPLPVLDGKNTDIYLREADTPASIPALLGLNLYEYRVNANGKRIEVAQLGDEAKKLFAMMKPHPRDVVAKFGLGLLSLGDGLVFGAHPVTQVVFDVPAGARRVRTSFGILPGAYADPLKGTDGVFFQILLRQADGTIRVLAERLLEPGTKEKDRGTQTLDVDLPTGTAGEVILHTGPGPANNFAFDWAYWSSVAIE
jgi:MFS family permease